MSEYETEYETEYSGSIERLSENEFNSLKPSDARGLPMFFTVLNDGQIKIWPALDTAQVIFKCDLV